MTIGHSDANMKKTQFYIQETHGLGSGSENTLLNKLLWYKIGECDGSDALQKLGIWVCQN